MRGETAGWNPARGCHEIAKNFNLPLFTRYWTATALFPATRNK